MAKKGIKNSSIEQIRKDHETESAFMDNKAKKHHTDGAKKGK
ncbi:biofilm-forming protein [Gracilibacillus xinjiangensis]|uniref:Biofilm-forming protein n=1 Tax=Gracilibacillus xinjiangensis TaxID=1193282 RepID=A0ABV8WS59_9BACI